MTDEPTARRHIVGVAIRVHGEVLSMPRPARHADLLRVHHADHDHPHPILDRGFVLADGDFVNRLEASDLAMCSGQIVAPKWPPCLYSEDLW